MLRIQTSMVLAENMPAAQMFGYRALLSMLLTLATFYDQLKYSFHIITAC
jgi:hypothetical protein